MSHRTMVMVKRTYLHIAVLTMMTAVLWLLVSIYLSLTTPAEVTVDAGLREAIKPSLDQEVFDEIVGRESLSELSFEPPSPATASGELEVSEEVEVVEEASESAEVANE